MRIRLRQFQCRMLSDTDVDDHYNPFVRLIEIEKNNSQCGFKLTRGKWDPYPWVSDVDEGLAAHTAGLKAGDCVLEVNGKDVIGMKICDIAEIVKLKDEQVSLLLWNAGVGPSCSPEAICCGPLPKNLQRLSACMSKILAFLECPVCLDTIPPPAYQCDNGHLICMRCRAKSEKCPVCRQRLQRGRSLISDQIYHAVTDTFNLKEDNEETRSTKIQQIFKNKGKKSTVPNIKVTPVYTNKFLSRIIGKSSSVDNLSSDNCSSDDRRENMFLDANLKTKSLSTNEIFLPESPGVSRSGSVSRINRKPVHTLDINYNNNKPASYHGSFENLDRKIELTVPKNHISEQNNFSEKHLCNCPFVNKCTTKITGDLFEHFRNLHGENGPLVQYFSSNIKYFWKDLEGYNELCHMINKDDDIFFLKMNVVQGDNKDILSSKEIHLWVSHFGDKNSSQMYNTIIEFKNTEESVLLRLHIPVISLMSTSSDEVLDSKRSVYISSTTLELMGFYSGKTFFELKISKDDN